MSKTICIYHKNCAEGFGAAWVVRKHFGENKVEFIPANYQDTPPDVTGRIVYIVDFSYKRPELLAMAAQAKKIIILDHHASAEKELIELPDNVTAYFDMQRSGAMMTWDHLIGTEAPPLIRYIQDRDLWRFDYNVTKEVMAAVFSYPYEFKVWDGLMKHENINNLVAEGRAIQRHQDLSIQNHI
ncbi:MAG: phosphohydrolase, partial [Pseudomonadales bacterium]